MGMCLLRLPLERSSDLGSDVIYAGTWPGHMLYRDKRKRIGFSPHSRPFFNDLSSSGQMAAHESTLKRRRRFCDIVTTRLLIQSVRHESEFAAADR